MKHLSVNILLLITFVISQVNSGVILNKLSDTWGHIKCKAHTLGNNIYQHGHHHDPCTTSEDVNYPGQFANGRQFNGYGDPQQGHEFHGRGQSEHRGQFYGSNKNIDPYQEQNWLGYGQPNDNKGNVDQQPYGQRGHNDLKQGQSWQGSEGNYGQPPSSTTEKKSNIEDSANDSIHKVDNAASNSNSIGRISNTDSNINDGRQGKNDIGDTTVSHQTQDVLSSTSPTIDIRINGGHGDEKSSTTTAKPDGRRILSNIRTNCPEGSIADSKGICREAY